MSADDKVVDLMAALEKSVADAKARRGVAALTAGDIAFIRRSLDSCKHLGRVYGVADTTIGHIRKRQGKWAEQ